MVCIQRSQKDESQSTDGVGTLSKQCHDCGKPLTDVTFRRPLEVQKNKPRVVNERNAVIKAEEITSMSVFFF